MLRRRSGAAVRWRSEAVDAEDRITAIVVRAPKEELGFEPQVPTPEAEEMEAEWFPKHPDDPRDIFMACCSFCTHFCCAPDFHTAEIARNSGAGDTIFCTCHLSRYDPFQIDVYHRTIFEYPNAGPGRRAGRSRRLRRPSTAPWGFRGAKPDRGSSTARWARRRPGWTEPDPRTVDRA